MGVLTVLACAICAGRAIAAWRRTTFNPLVQGSTPWRPTRQNLVWIMVLVDRVSVVRVTGLCGELDLASRFEELAQTVADALDAAAPRGLAAPCCVGTTAGTSCGTAGPATSTPSGNYPPWPRLAARLRRPAPRPGPRSGVLRPLAPRHHAPCRRHHPHMRTTVRHAAPFLVTGRLSPGVLRFPVVRCSVTLAISISPSVGLSIAAMGDR
jgi:hypothetical protein